MPAGTLARSLTLAAALLASTPALAADAAPIDRDAFAADMRELWEEHVSWTRLYLVSATAGLPDKEATAQRLLENQADLGDAIKPFYGDAAGTKLTALLRDHILVAAELIDAAKAGDEAKQDDATKRWYANADEIAAFLSGANPRNWPPAEMKSMMRGHLDLTTEEVVAHLGKDWTKSIASYDKAREQILHMADALSSGIAAQHPAKFKA
jgi:hypothetical protein